MNSTPWHLIRSFLAVAHSGSLSAAARELGISQPTLSREIQMLERHTKLQLFRRSTRGVSLTETGESLLESAEKMAGCADLFDRQRSGLSTELAGEIRISANEIVGIYLLPAAIASFTREHPNVDIEIVISNQSSSLHKREADIALRMYRPTQNELVARRLPDMRLGFFAHRDYLAGHGIPQSLADLENHQLIGFDQNPEFISGAKAQGVELSRRDFRLRTDHLLMQLQLARQGCGIVVTHLELARQWPEMEQLLKDIPIPPLQFWVVCHADTQHNARICAFKNHLIHWFDKDAYHGLGM